MRRSGPLRLFAGGGRLWRKEGWALEEEGKFLGDPIWAENFGTGFDAINFSLNDFRWSMTSIHIDRSGKYGLPEERERRDEKD